jgi:uncharacterized repeat protein (TIGR01451 family)
VEHKFLNISLVLSAIAILSLSLFNPIKAYSQYYSSNDNKKEISVDKKLREINQNEYVDNITASNKTFFERDIIEFQIKVENIGNQTLNNINVIDTLPGYLGLIFHPGTFNSSNNKLEWKIDTLNPGEIKKYLIRARIQNSDQLSASLTKKTNRVEVTVENLNDSDTSSYFIGKPTVPDTGASDVIIKTILVALVGTSGFYFRKLARGY